MSSDPRTRGLHETCNQRGPQRPLHNKAVGRTTVEKSLAAAAEPFKGITTDGRVIPGLFGMSKPAFRRSRFAQRPKHFSDR